MAVWLTGPPGSLPEARSPVHRSPVSTAGRSRISKPRWGRFLPFCASCKNHVYGARECAVSPPDELESLVVVAAAIVQEGRLLVVSKQAAPEVFYLPGGKPDADEEPMEALMPELDEELGVQRM
ncbi:NUDIX domain-containing protein [Streptomyces sp. NPDC056656]|uniref:NUDIX domain-containing protein n=1 Tax=Streptomyces sp. NPDC056656 TaxID=3345895 RepID=UPI0036CB7F1E